MTYNGGFSDAFVAKVNAAGTALVYCGYIGGSDDDYGYAIAVDSGGNAYATGRTESSQPSFPVVVGPDLTFNNAVGTPDGFVAKVNASGSALSYCGYIGGSGFDYGKGIAVDSQGSAYVVGIVWSTETTFPVTVGPDLTFNSGYFDAFVAKVNSAGTGLSYCGYIGGSLEDFASGVAVDGSGNALCHRIHLFHQTTFPVAVGPDLTYNGGYDVFVAKVNASGAGLNYCGYIGGSAREYAIRDRR